MHPAAISRPLHQARPVLASVGVTAAALLYLCCPAIARAQASDSIPVAVKGHLPRLAWSTTLLTHPPRDPPQRRRVRPSRTRQIHNSPAASSSTSRPARLLPCHFSPHWCLSWSGRSRSRSGGIVITTPPLNRCCLQCCGVGLGLSFGPSIGYAYSGEHFRGWGMDSAAAWSRGVVLGSVGAYASAWSSNSGGITRRRGSCLERSRSSRWLSRRCMTSPPLPRRSSRQRAAWSDPTSAWYPCLSPAGRPPALAWPWSGSSSVQASL